MLQLLIDGHSEWESGASSLELGMLLPLSRGTK
jgi:hypothetical protein